MVGIDGSHCLGYMIIVLTGDKGVSLRDVFLDGFL